MSVNPFLSKAVANKALSLAQNALQNEAVRKQIRDAPEAVGRWAKSVQQDHAAGAGPLASLSRLDPTARFNQAGIERRLDALTQNVEMVFPEPDDSTRRSTLAAVHEFRRALVVAAPLPLMKRKRVHLRIDAELGVLEQALVDAVLPPPATGTASADGSPPESS